ncbi:hypothetical protein RI054_23g98420 [Pseudoscourfieldia marina]
MVARSLAAVHKTILPSDGGVIACRSHVNDALRRTTAQERACRGAGPGGDRSAGTASMTTARDEQDDMPQRRATRAHTSRHDNMARSVSNDAKSRRNRVPPLAGTMSMTTARDEQDDMPQRRATRAHTSRHDNMARSVSNDAKSRRNRVPPLAGTMSMTTARDEQDDVRQRRATRAHTSRLDNMACAPPLADITNTRMSRGKHQHATAVSLLNATRAREQDDRSTPPKKLRPSDGVTQPPPSTMTLPTPTPLGRHARSSSRAEESLLPLLVLLPSSSRGANASTM